MLNKLSLIDMLDLSVVELLILELLIRHNNPIVRITLYEEVNEYLELDKKLSNFDSEEETVNEKTIETDNFGSTVRKDYLISEGSFYHSLKNLANRGFIKFNKNAKGRIITVEKTSLTMSLIDNMIQHFIKFIGLTYDFTLVEKLVEYVMQKTGIQEFNSILVIWLYIAFDMRLLNFLKTIPKKLFLLSRIQDSNILKQRGLEGVEITSVFDGKIREANNIFDSVVIPYSSRYGFKNLSLKDFMKEGMRVLKKGGMLVVIIEQKAPSSYQHSALNRLAKIYNKANKDEIYSKKEIMEILTELNIRNYEFLNQAGEWTLLIHKVKT